MRQVIEDLVSAIFRGSEGDVFLTLHQHIGHVFVAVLEEAAAAVEGFGDARLHLRDTVGGIAGEVEADFTVAVFLSIIEP